MGEKTGIAWTDSTWNPVRGCTKVSAGCKNCYAETFAERWRGVPGHAFEQGFDLRLVPEALELPLRWKKPRRVFVNSMSDLFHEGVPFDYIDQVFGVMKLASRHTFQVLTKRASRMREFLARAAPDLAGLPNVWLGVSVEDQRAADERIPELLATPAAVRFLSCEPILGPVNLRPTVDAWAGEIARRAVGGQPVHPLPPRISWVIVGGESGPGARPCDIGWVRDLVGQCKEAGVPVFVKQLGAAASGMYRELPFRRILDRAGRDPAEWPADLRVQQFPGAP